MCEFFTWLREEIGLSPVAMAIVVNGQNIEIIQIFMPSRSTKYKFFVQIN